MDHTRPEWTPYFLAMACIASARSTCLRRTVGAVLVLGNQVLSTGYNGSPAGTRHCSETGCLREQLRVPSGKMHEICRGSHAEMNAIAQAARHGLSVDGCTLYCTHEPCSICTKLLINAGCRRMVFMDPYPDELSRTLREEAGVVVEIWEDKDAVRAVFESASGGLPKPQTSGSGQNCGENVHVSAREREVLTLVGRGLTMKEIASELYISERTVQTHMNSIYEKLGARNRAESTLIAIKLGIVQVEDLLMQDR